VAIVHITHRNHPGILVPEVGTEVPTDAVAAGANEADRDAIAGRGLAIGAQDLGGHNLRPDGGEARRGGRAADETPAGNTTRAFHNRSRGGLRFGGSFLNGVLMRS